MCSVDQAILITGGPCRTGRKNLPPIKADSLYPAGASIYKQNAYY